MRGGGRAIRASERRHRPPSVNPCAASGPEGVLRVCVRAAAASAGRELHLEVELGQIRIAHRLFELVD
eukprot:scaffold4498_cov119-Isochrysis_galbana.AAC.4